MWLPNDCIYDILKHLKNDRSALFNCLFKNQCLFITTLIFCLNETETLQLKNSLSAKPFNIHIKINPEYKQLFEYPKYIEIIDSIRITNIVLNWINWIINITKITEY